SGNDVPAQDRAPQQAQVDRERRGERPRRELREGEALEIVLLLDPPSPLDEVGLHVAGERDRPAKAECAEAKEVAREVTEARAAGSGLHFAPCVAPSAARTPFTRSWTRPMPQ